MRTPDHNFGLVRRARRALLIIPVVMAVAVIATVLASWWTIRQASEVLTHDQAAAVFQAVRAGASGSVADVALLQEVLDQHAAAGLRCLATLGPGEHRLVIAGSCSTPVAALERALRLGEIAVGGERGSRVRMVEGMPRILIELEPVRARQLRISAVRGLAIGGAAALALIAAAILCGRIVLRAERQQEQSERDRQLAVLGKMSAVLAHEIRNPLAAMKGHAQLLAEALPTTTREHDKAERVVSEAVRLEKLSGELLSFVRSQQVDRVAADPAAVLRKAANTIDDQRVELDLEDAPASWSMDVDKMQQVLRNLLRNALQASGDGGRARAAVHVAGDRLVFTVRDFGDGIEEGEADRIFEPFYTTRVRGTGLGLAVARRIVELHGGEISTTNHPAGGAVFRVAIPGD